jgi:hypothetical protein
MRASLRTAGVRVELNSAHRWLTDVLGEATAGELSPDDGAGPDVRVVVENSPAAFDTRGWDVLTRGAWRRPGQVIVHDACTSGVDLRVTAAGPTLQVTARWRPPLVSRAASAMLRARARLLVRAVLIHYPALWWSQQHGRAPLHASVCSLGLPLANPAADCGRIVLLAGPGGVGKSTLVNAELTMGALATCDNLCVSDGRTAWGLVEPLRVQPGEVGTGRGRRMPHGRRETSWPRRADSMTPDCLVVLRRGHQLQPAIEACPPAEAARHLAAGTYMAGELRRYWAFAATLALGTGVGDAHPDISAVTSALTARLPCILLTLGGRPGLPLSGLLGELAQAEVAR